MSDTTERPPAWEVLAEQAHIMWAHWMRYQLDVCNIQFGEAGEGDCYLIPADKVERWRRLTETPYADLTEQERESDREQADRMRAALAAAGYPVQAGPALVEALEFANKQMGWHGRGARDADYYYCEHCAGPPELDSKDIVHEPKCPVYKVRAALALAKQEPAP